MSEVKVERRHRDKAYRIMRTDHPREVPIWKAWIETGGLPDEVYMFTDLHSAVLIAFALAAAEARAAAVAYAKCQADVVAWLRASVAEGRAAGAVHGPAAVHVVADTIEQGEHIGASDKREG